MSRRIATYSFKSENEKPPGCDTSNVFNRQPLKETSALFVVTRKEKRGSGITHLTQLKVLCLAVPSEK